MAKIADLRFKYRALMAAYRWRRLDPVPCATLVKPISECRVALVTSAGLVAPGDAEFDQNARGGDFSFRVIHRGTDVQSLTESHRSDTFDHDGIEADKNLALPLDRLEELATDGIIGEVAPRHLSFMGSITAPGRLVKTSAPEAASLLVEDGVDIALLVPV